MPCAVATVSNSPIFMQSPRKLAPVFCKPATSPRPPPALSPLAMKHIRRPAFFAGEDELAPAKAPAMVKRKRPGMISIPVTSMLAIEDVVNKEESDRLSEMEFEGEGYSVYCKRGKRGGILEDRYAAVLGSQGDSKQAFFGVFDGHGGPGAAEYVAKNLEKNVMKEVVEKGDELLEEAVKEGYLNTDSDFLKEDIGGGTCCVTAVIRNEEVVVSNAGDCRAVMSRGGVAEALTVDHRPSLEDERERIERLGGYVDCCRGAWRVHGTLAVSRAIGDRHLKQWVIAEPTSKVFKITPECEFLILASDGLWDKVSNQEAVDIVKSFCVNVDKPQAFAACKNLVELSLTRGSMDDTTVMVIQLPHFVKGVEEQLRLEDLSVPAGCN